MNLSIRRILIFVCYLLIFTTYLCISTPVFADHYANLSDWQQPPADAHWQCHPQTPDKWCVSGSPTAGGTGVRKGDGASVQCLAWDPQALTLYDEICSQKGLTPQYHCYNTCTVVGQPPESPPPEVPPPSGDPQQTTSFNCVNNVCSAVSGSGGTFGSLKACTDAGCGGQQTTSYNCVNNACSAVSGSGGTFEFLTDCQASCAPPENPPNAQCISKSIPTNMTVGQSYTATIIMKNTGGTRWESGSGYKLGSQDPQDNVKWGFNRVVLPSDIEQLQNSTFTFSVTPSVAGSNQTFAWKMVQEGVSWFGDKCSVEVNVAPPPAGECSIGGNFACSGSTRMVNLYWNPVKNATSYSIGRSPAGFSRTTSSTSTTDSSVADNTSYTYNLTAVAAGGNKTCSANIVTTTCGGEAFNICGREAANSGYSSHRCLTTNQTPTGCVWSGSKGYNDNLNPPSQMGLCGTGQQFCYFCGGTTPPPPQNGTTCAQEAQSRGYSSWSCGTSSSTTGAGNGCTFADRAGYVTSTSTVASNCYPNPGYCYYCSGGAAPNPPPQNPPPPLCGNGICNLGETCNTCAADCICYTQIAPTCGDGICNGAEGCSTCPGDCGICTGDDAEYCGNGVCEPEVNESCSVCPSDCGACFSGPTPIPRGSPYIETRDGDVGSNTRINAP